MTNPLTIARILTLLFALLGIFVFAGALAFGQNITPPALPVDPLDMSAVQLLSNLQQLPVVSLTANYPWVRIDTVPYATNESVEIVSYDPQYFLRFGVQHN